MNFIKIDLIYMGKNILDLQPQKHGIFESKNYKFKEEKDYELIRQQDYIIKKFLEYSSKNINKYSKIKNIKLIDQGISYISGLSACLFCEFLDIDVIIESGIAVGTSTEIFAEYFKDKNIIHYGVDYTDNNHIQLLGKNHVWTNNTTFNKTRKRLKKYNINFIEGDSFEEIPKIFQKNNNFINKRVFLCIDGPKEDEQIKLMNSLCNKYPSIKLIFCDDIGLKMRSTIYKNVSRGEIFMDNKKSLFLSNNKEFVKVYNIDGGENSKKEHFGFGINNVKEVRRYIKNKIR